MNLCLKFRQNQVSNSWDITDIEFLWGGVVGWWGGVGCAKSFSCQTQLSLNCCWVDVELGFWQFELPDTFHNWPPLFVSLTRYNSMDPMVLGGPSPAPICNSTYCPAEGSPLSLAGCSSTRMLVSGAFWIKKKREKKHHSNLLSCWGIPTFAGRLQLNKNVCIWSLLNPKKTTTPYYIVGGVSLLVPLGAVDLDRKIVWNKLALLWGSPLIYAFCWIRGGSVRSFWPIAAQNGGIWTCTV